MTDEEFENLAVGVWHKVAKQHDINSCNCFRVALHERMEELRTHAV